ncbi:methyltransferase [Prauserella sp. PE36]|uniref:HemK2/MTQ2 family protein methyltransferase n=1 Tax=Prauserella sp. PE36 TaxID=1504709 RepID=UPI000D9CA937|nr:HemK2/MTQ2 family protein methyltransferase [Prauserella sp. PE36]PXY21784.1 methyltransferase [Prauserella coralliicola]RBM13861.1 methyltransferase [Prauserella sp. PE36]
MWLLRPPGVYRPQEDTNLLAGALRTASMPVGARVLDACTGTGALALAAARAGAGEVAAVDVSRRALAAAWCNARLRRVPLSVRRGDVTALAGLGRFDVVLANPPYVPCERTSVAKWDAGADGRAVLDPLCTLAPDLLNWQGFLLLVQSELSGVDETVGALRTAGLKTSIVARRRIPFGPVLRGRARFLEERGLIEPGRRDEELVVIRADRAERTAA